MARSIVFTRNDVIEAGFDIVREEGIHFLTARKVATEMNASTAPVYSHFASMDELRREVIIKSKELLTEYTVKNYEFEEYIDIGIGIVLFAQEEGNLYKALFLENTEDRDIVNDFLINMKIKLDKNQSFSSIDSFQRIRLLYKMWFFAHGFATLTCAGLYKSCSASKIGKVLNETGESLINDALRKHGSE